MVVCSAIDEEHGLIIYTEEYNKKCVVLYSDESNNVKVGDTIVIDPRVVSVYDSEKKWFYIPEYNIKAVIR